MSDIADLQDKFEKFLDEDKACSEGIELAAKILIDRIEFMLCQRDYVIPENVAIIYDSAIDRGLWDQHLVDELNKVKLMLKVEMN